MIRDLVVCAMVCTAAVPSLAHAAGEQPAAEATERFNRGLRLFNEGDDQGAAIEFKRVYEMVGRVEALYNLGLALAELNRPVDAVDALDRVIVDPRNLTAQALTNAHRVRDEQAARIATLTVETNIPARLDVDNVEMGRTPLASPLRLAAGARLVTVVAKGYAPAVTRVTLAGGERAAIRLDLVAMVGKLSQLRVKSALPGADVLVDSQVVGRTPLPASVPVTPGRHEVRLRRSGYADAARDINLDEGAAADVELDPDEMPGAGPRGRIHFTLSESDANVFVNGHRRADFRAGLMLPEGTHRLEVHRSGFFPMERDILVRADRDVTVQATLDPTEETRAAWVGNAIAQRRRGLIVLAAGVLVAGGGTIIYLANRNELQGAHTEYDAVRADLQPGGVCYADFNQPDCLARTNHANDRLARVESWRWVGPTVAGVGLAAAITGSVLRLLADDPGKYDHARTDVAGGVHPHVFLGHWSGGGVAINF